MSRYWKTIITVAGAALTILNTFTADVNQIVADDQITGAEWRTILILVVTAVGVYLKANTPPAGQPSDPNVSETAHH